MKEIQIKSNIKNVPLSAQHTSSYSTVHIPDLFISKVLCKAPAEAIKVLFGVIASSSTNSSEVSKISNSPEYTVSKSIEYWKDRGVIRQDPLTGNYEVSFAVPNDDINSKNTIISFAEEYIGRELSLNELQTILYISKDLNFTDELLKYLITYCADKKSFNAGFIKTVAIAWDEKGIKTAKDASEAPTKYPKKIYEFLKIIGRNNNIAPVEKETVLKWIEEYKISDELIKATLEQTALKGVTSKLLYADRIMENYQRNNITTIEQARSFNQSAIKNTQPNKTHCSTDREYDFDALEKMFMKKASVRYKKNHPDNPDNMEENAAKESTVS